MFTKKEGIDYISNFYRYKLYNRENKLYLITSDSGSFIFLNSSAFKQLKRGKIEDENIYNKLLTKEIIINETNLNYLINKIKIKYHHLENGTTLHIVIPTSRCNLACTYCFASPDPISAPKEEKDLDENTAKKIIEFILKSPQKAVTIEFQGGEAIARYDLVIMMAKYAKKLNEKYNKSLNLTIVTNLTLMTENIADLLIENEISICTSLDGPKNVHDKNRIIHLKNDLEIGTYDKVIYWINRINEKYIEKKSNQRVNAVLTVSAHSLNFYKEIIDEYIKNNLKIISLRSLTYVGKAIENSKKDLLYKNEDFIKYYLKSINYLEKLKNKGYEIEEEILNLYKTKIIEQKSTYHTEFESPCGAATGQITYHSNGDIYTCHEALGRDEFKLGNVHIDKWQDIFKKEETAKAILNSMLEANVICDRCAYKPYCATCMVENFYHFKKFNYYPSKTSKHHETIMHSRRIFDELLKDIKISNNS